MSMTPKSRKVKKGTIHVYTGDPNKQARLAPRHIIQQISGIAEWIVMVKNARDNFDIDQCVQQAFLDRGRSYSTLFSGSDHVYVFRYSMKEWGGGDKTGRYYHTGI